MNETSRNQGWAITAGAVFLGLVFLVGILNQSYWAIAIPIAVLVFFVLGLVAWVGHTIATVQVEPETPIEATPQPAPQPATQAEPKPDTSPESQAQAS